MPSSAKYVLHCSRPDGIMLLKIPPGREVHCKGMERMKFVFIIGSGAVGKMTVGQELMKLTGLRLFHNHMAIEPVIAIFGDYEHEVVDGIRDVIFRSFAASDLPGMIFTYMWAFDMKADWDYVEHVKSIFAPYGTEFYYVELIAPQAIRLSRSPRFAAPSIWRSLPSSTAAAT